MFRGLYRTGGAKLISLALVKTNPRNKLGDMISKTLCEIEQVWDIEKEPLGFLSFFLPECLQE